MCGWLCGVVVFSLFLFLFCFLFLWGVWSLCLVLTLEPGRGVRPLIGQPLCWCVITDWTWLFNFSSLFSSSVSTYIHCIHSYIHTDRQTDGQYNTYKPWRQWVRAWMLSWHPATTLVGALIIISPLAIFPTARNPTALGRTWTLILSCIFLCVAVCWW